MPPRPLDSLAYALAAAHDIDSALLALSDGLSEVERSAYVGLVRHDAKSGLLTELLSPAGPRVEHSTLEVAFAHLPSTVAPRIAAGAEFIDAADQSKEYARLLGIKALPDGGHLSLKGVLHEGQLAAVVVCYEAKRIFGARAIERFAPSVALFEMCFVRFLEREARSEAVKALEEVTRRVHAEHMAKLTLLESQLATAREGGQAARQSVAIERDNVRTEEELRRAQQRARALEHQVGAGTAQLEQAHVELHRRNELLRQRTRTLYLLERALALAASTDDAKVVADGLLSLVGDVLQAQRCSLFLKAPEPGALFLAAARGLSPHIKEGQRIKIGDGVAGKVAKTREPVLVVDSSDGSEPKLLGDEYLTTASFMSFPLLLHDELVGVINLTNRAQRGLFVEDDVERVRLLALVCGLVAVESKLSERLAGPPPRA
jgi:hypothetical protein